jgi:hypothetical protein
MSIYFAYVHFYLASTVLSPKLKSVLTCCRTQTFADVDLALRNTGLFQQYSHRCSYPSAFSSSLGHPEQTFLSSLLSSALRHFAPVASCYSSAYLSICLSHTHDTRQACSRRTTSSALHWERVRPSFRIHCMSTSVLDQVFHYWAALQLVVSSGCGAYGTLGPHCVQDRSLQCLD